MSTQGAPSSASPLDHLLELERRLKRLSPSLAVRDQRQSPILPYFIGELRLSESPVPMIDEGDALHWGDVAEVLANLKKGIIAQSAQASPASSPSPEPVRSASARAASPIASRSGKASPLVFQGPQATACSLSKPTPQRIPPSIDNIVDRMMEMELLLGSGIIKGPRYADFDAYIAKKPVTAAKLKNFFERLFQCVGDNFVFTKQFNELLPSRGFAMVQLMKQNAKLRDFLTKEIPLLEPINIKYLKASNRPKI